MRPWRDELAQGYPINPIKIGGWAPALALIAAAALGLGGPRVSPGASAQATDRIDFDLVGEIGAGFSAIASDDEVLYVGRGHRLLVFEKGADGHYAFTRQSPLLPGKVGQIAVGEGFLALGLIEGRGDRAIDTAFVKPDDLDHPVLASTLPQLAPMYRGNLSAAGKRLAVMAGSCFDVIDMTHFGAPRLLAPEPVCKAYDLVSVSATSDAVYLTYYSGDFHGRVFANDLVAYALDGDRPPKEAGSLDLPGPAWLIASGDYVFVVPYSSYQLFPIYAVDVSNIYGLRLARKIGFASVASANLSSEYRAPDGSLNINSFGYIRMLAHDGRVYFSFDDQLYMVDSTSLTTTYVGGGIPDGRDVNGLAWYAGRLWLARPTSLLGMDVSSNRIADVVRVTLDDLDWRSATVAVAGRVAYLIGWFAPLEDWTDASWPSTSPARPVPSWPGRTQTPCHG